ncbi:MAG: hypothetical protein JXR70_09185 [Spirochaetales bacterium]|nr:hypothetical protein [Spirochaetales bacterium]
MHKKALSLIITTSLLIMLFSCGSPETAELVLEDALPNAQVLQDLVGVIDAAQGVYEDEGSSSKAFYPGAVDVTELPEGADSTPADFFTTYGPPEDGVVRCPAEGFFVNPSDGENDLGFDNSLGTMAFLELKDLLDETYLVKLYMFQTLSPLVEYEYEEYIVPADDWYTQVYLAWETYYYGGLVEERTIVDNETTYLADDYFAMPEDFSDAAYDYPGSIIFPNAGAADFSLYSTGEITFGKKYLKERINLTEFYTEVSGESYSKSFSTLDLSVFCLSTRLAETVTIWHQDTEQNKTVRMKSVGEFGLFSKWITTLTGVIETGMDETGRNVYDALWNMEKSRNQQRIFDSGRRLLLTETAVDSNQYTGAMAVQRNNKVFTYDVTMGPAGLYISKGTFDVIKMGDVKELEDIDVDFEDNSHFHGKYRKGLFEGEYTHHNGKKCSIVVDAHMKHLRHNSGALED